MRGRRATLLALASVLATMPACAQPPPNKERAVRIIELREATDDRTATAPYVAELHVSADGRLELRPRGEPASLPRMREAVQAVEKRDLLHTRETQPRVIDGKTVRVLTRIDVGRTDPRYPWAVADTLQKEFGFGAKVRP
jgi:hypothetical protein